MQQSVNVGPTKRISIVFQSGKNTTLLRQLEEQTLQMKDMNQELVDVKQTLAHTQKGMSIGLDKHFKRKIVNYFLPISLNICLGCSKEPSH